MLTLKEDECFEAQPSRQSEAIEQRSRDESCSIAERSPASPPSRPNQALRSQQETMAVHGQLASGKAKAQWPEQAPEPSSADNPAGSFWDQGSTCLPALERAQEGASTSTLIGDGAARSTAAQLLAKLPSCTVPAPALEVSSTRADTAQAVRSTRPRPPPAPSLILPVTAPRVSLTQGASVEIQMVWPLVLSADAGAPRMMVRTAPATARTDAAPSPQEPPSTAPRVTVSIMHDGSTLVDLKQQPGVPQGVAGRVPPLPRQSRVFSELAVTSAFAILHGGAGPVPGPSISLLSVPQQVASELHLHFAIMVYEQAAQLRKQRQAESSDSSASLTQV